MTKTVGIAGDAFSSTTGNTAAKVAIERRFGGDRRRRPTPKWSRYLLRGGRRAQVRRAEEREGTFLDRFGPRVFAMVMAVVVLNLLDAFFTLFFLSHGGQEMNPFVQSILALSSHPWPFLVFKTAGIGIACAFLAHTQNFRSARIGLWLVLVGYALLLGWHLVLLSWLDSIVGLFA